MSQISNSGIDPRSGFCSSNSVFFSKRIAFALPSNHCLDITTFISSYPHHGKTAFIDAATGRHLSFPELWQAVDSVATCLSDLGIRKGQVILIIAPNSIFFPIVCLSVLSIGAILTTSNPLNTPREIALQMADSKPALVFTTSPLVLKLTDSSLPIVLMDQHASINAREANIVATMDQMLKKKLTEPRVRERVYQDDPACILYSSGTTGKSKGVVSSHRNLIAMIQAFSTVYKPDEAEQTAICPVPMFHIFGFGVFVIGKLTSGTTVVVLSKFNMNETLSAVDKYRATSLPLVPPILVALVKGADEIRRKYDLSSLQSVTCGGAPLSKEVIDQFSDKFPTVSIYQGYALTESVGAGASMLSPEDSQRYGAVGRLSPNLQAKIVDPETGAALKVNQTGELWIRGPTIMKGYLNNEEATAAAIDSEGWLKTGDLCYIDEDGFLFVVDRLKELIKCKGYQVAPAELEALLLSHPQISDAAVIPFPDEEVGEYPMAYVVRKNNGSNVSEEAVMDFIARQVAPYKRIRKVAFVASIPKNPSGKILRRELIKLATSKI